MTGFVLTPAASVSTIAFPSMLPHQVQPAILDFGKIVGSGVTLTGVPTVTLTVMYGTDDTPQSHLSGDPAITTASTAVGGSGLPNVAVAFTLSQLVAGVEYTVDVYCGRSDGGVAEVSTRVSGTLAV